MNTLPIPESSAPSASGAPAAALIVMILYIVMIFAIYAVSILAYVLQGIGYLKMHKQLGLGGGWMSFIPYLNYIAYGKVAQQYIKKNGKKSAKFAIILPLSYVFLMLFAVIVGIVIGIMGGVMASIGTTEAAGMSIILIFAAFAFTLIACGVVTVLDYVALWRVFAIFSGSPTLLLLLSIFVPIARPFVVFALRKNEPKCVEKQDEVVFEEIPAEI